MGYHIHAWLENGQPRLKILDPLSNTVWLEWSYEGWQSETPAARREVQRLFRDLLLLSCRQNCSAIRKFSVKVVSPKWSEIPLADVSTVYP